MLMSHPMTRMPSLASARAVAFPLPLPAPVTSAVRPAQLFLSDSAIAPADKIRNVPSRACGSLLDELIVSGTRQIQRSVWRVSSTLVNRDLSGVDPAEDSGFGQGGTHREGPTGTLFFLLCKYVAHSWDTDWWPALFASVNMTRPLYLTQGSAAEDHKSTYFTFCRDVVLSFSPCMKVWSSRVEQTPLRINLSSWTGFNTLPFFRPFQKHVLRRYAPDRRKEKDKFDTRTYLSFFCNTTEMQIRQPPADACAREIEKKSPHSCLANLN